MFFFFLEDREIPMREQRNYLYAFSDFAVFGHAKSFFFWGGWGQYSLSILCNLQFCFLIFIIFIYFFRSHCQLKDYTVRSDFFSLHAIENKDKSETTNF